MTNVEALYYYDLSLTTQLIDLSAYNASAWNEVMYILIPRNNFNIFLFESKSIYFAVHQHLYSIFELQYQPNQLKMKKKTSLKQFLSWRNQYDQSNSNLTVKYKNF